MLSVWQCRRIEHVCIDLRAAARREGAMEDAEKGKFTEEVSRGGGRGWDKEASVSRGSIILQLKVAEPVS